ncbi:MAG TPA: hypothetical protein DCZ94_11500 [Lentisphaeria bacterium]|nr:MAG: hypothetical protein A2X48_17585 [Lentisphaerae bacterium GWF2_49_21]HBC87572.1 hypothetical protein [Lentisphaeria bacterium]
MKKMLVLAGSVLALGLLVGCEDKQAEAQQNANIESLKSDIARMNSDIGSLQSENRELRGKIGLVTEWLKKKVQEEKDKAAKAAAAVAPKTTTATKTATGAKTSDPKKKMFP